MATAERVTMSQAAEMLGLSPGMIRQLVHHGVLVAEPNPLDQGDMLIRVADIERFKSQETQSERPWPRTIGAADLGIQSDELEDWLESAWHPC